MPTKPIQMIYFMLSVFLEDNRHCPINPASSEKRGAQKERRKEGKTGRRKDKERRRRGRENFLLYNTGY